MSIIDLQRRIAEVGRIRIGHQVPTERGKTRPEKLATFRLTSQDRGRIDAAAALWGGTSQQWDAPSGRQWEVVTEATSLDVIVPPAAMAFSQYYEQWSAGGCVRRCDGVTESISDGPCLCDPDARECDIHSRLSVMLRDLPGLGVWRIDTSGYYAAVELGAAVEIVLAAAGAGALLPARLRLEQRMVKRRDPASGKVTTLRFGVPVLDVDITPGQLVSGQVGQPAALDQPEPVRAALTPVSAPERSVPSIAEQAAAVDVAPEPKTRRNAQVPLPPTGLEPRPAPAPLDDAWIELVQMLVDPPAPALTVPVIETQVRRLFALMAEVGVWPVGDGPDPLHLALRKHHQAEHLGDLRKDSLVVFAGETWEAARAAVAVVGNEEREA